MPNTKATDQASLVGSFVPAGVIMPFGGATAPSGWLLCNGSAVSRTTYAPLFAAVASAWGYGDNATTFNLPDLRGRFLRGRNANGSVVNEPVADAAARTACATGGNTAENVGSVQVHNYASHGHSIAQSGGAFSSVANGSNNQAVPLAGWDGNLTGVNCGCLVASSAGGNETRSNNAYVNYIIKY